MASSGSPGTGDDRLRIDRAACAIRVWERGTHKLWLSEDAPGAEPSPPVVASLPPPTGSSIALGRPLAATVRFWRHRTPRPDSVALRLRLLPHDGDIVQVRAEPVPEQPHKPVVNCLVEGFAASCRELGCLPIAGFAIEVLALVDDGPSSAEGLRLGAEHGLAALLLAGYRQGALPYL